MSFLKNTFAFALCGAAMIAMCADASARPRHRAAVAAEAATAAPDDRFANAKASAGEQGVTEATTIGRETSLRTYGSSRERDEP